MPLPGQRMVPFLTGMTGKTVSPSGGHIRGFSGRYGVTGGTGATAVMLLTIFDVKSRYCVNMTWRAGHRAGPAAASA